MKRTHSDILGQNLRDAALLACQPFGQARWLETHRSGLRGGCTGSKGDFPKPHTSLIYGLTITKDTYKALGPNAGIPLLAKMTPAMDVFDAVSKHVHWQFETVLGRGTKHTTPNADRDIDKYMRVIIGEKWMKEKKRKMKKPANRAKDFMTEGMKTLFPATGASTIDSWWNKRAYARATTETWIEKPEGTSLAHGEFPTPEVTEADEPLPPDEAGDENFEGEISELEMDSGDESIYFGRGAES